MTTCDFNLKIRDKLVGKFRQGDVIPLDAIEGGIMEANRLVSIGAVEWVGESPTVMTAASATAVAEMDDDELKAENEQLHRMLQAVQAERDEARAKAAHLEAAIRDLEAGDLKKLTEERDAARAAAADLAADVEKARDSVSALTLQRDELAKQVETLEAAATDPKPSRKK